MQRSRVLLRPTPRTSQRSRTRQHDALAFSSGSRRRVGGVWRRKPLRDVDSRRSRRARRPGDARRSSSDLGQPPVSDRRPCERLHGERSSPAISTVISCMAGGHQRRSLCARRSRCCEDAAALACMWWITHQPVGGVQQVFLLSGRGRGRERRRCVSKGGTRGAAAGADGTRCESARSRKERHGERGARMVGHTNEWLVTLACVCGPPFCWSLCVQFWAQDAPQ